MLVNWSDILDGEIVNAAWAVAQMAAKPRTSRRTSADLDTVAWADTEHLIRDALAEIAAGAGIPHVATEDAAALEAELRRHEVQGALQALLAARLTDAPETQAAQAREAVRLALLSEQVTPTVRADRRGKATIFYPAGPASADSSGTSLAPLPGFEAAGPKYATVLSEYFDDKICALVATLEGKVGFAGLAQVRSEAYSARIVALLGAIERQVAALGAPEANPQAEAQWIARCRRQIRERHGKIEPPDFDRRRRVPLEQIYVDTSVYEYADNRVDFGWHAAGASSMRVTHLGELIGRTVLLGDPGGGKTTATSVLANRFASDDAGSLPFLVTLRDYAAKDPPEQSVASHIERTLETLYQCAPPAGLVERLLLTGRALVIFDGLDELLDTSRRRDVSDRVEQFCSAYPLTPVLVTSRAVGYGEANLDPHQFSCYRLGGFGESEVRRYVTKWFAVQEHLSPAEAGQEAESFLDESSAAPDLRYNPLMLSLMCILYRGAGSLPRDRAGIYARCAELLLGKWDERRRIHHELQAGYLVEPAIRHVAWWLFTGEDPSAAVTERALVDEVAGFLYEHGFESAVQARAAAAEFVAFCRGRMWVLGEVGTTGHGDKLYAFNHRTFLEYFAAAHLATVSDTPEILARRLAPYVGTAQGWNLVGELAIHIKDRNSDRGADRIYATLLDPATLSGERGPLLRFLVEGLASVLVTPGTLRLVVRALVAYELNEQSALDGTHPLLTLFRICDLEDSRRIIAEELASWAGAMVAADDAESRLAGLLIPLEINTSRTNDYWSLWSAEQIARYRSAIVAQAECHPLLRTPALKARVISLEQALAMPGGFGELMSYRRYPLSAYVSEPYPVSLTWKIFRKSTPRPAQISDDHIQEELSLIGHYVADHPALPWARAVSVAITVSAGDRPSGTEGYLDAYAGLGLAAIYAVKREITRESRIDLTGVPMPAGFKGLFRDWAEDKVSFVELEHGEVAV